MKKLAKRFISFILILSIVCSMSVVALAAEPNSYVKLSLTDAEIQEGIERALQIKLSEINDISERMEAETAIRENLKNINISASATRKARGIDLGAIWEKGLPDIHIKNKYVAATIDTILSGILIASGVGSLSVALKKFGAKELEHIFIRTIKKKVIGKAAIALGISLPTIAGFVSYVTDPAGRIAEFLDSKDKNPNNGYLDVIW